MDPIIVIKRIIVEKDLKKQSVAQKIGLTRQQFSDLLNYRRGIKGTEVPLICNALEITPNELYGYSDDETA